MPGLLFHLGATATCPHGGPISVITTNARVLVSGQPVATVTDTFPVTGCAFTLPNGKPQPCVLTRWLVPAVRVTVMGQPVILNTSTGICQSVEQIPQGPPIVVVTQPRVTGT